MVNILGQTITTINARNKKKQAIYLGQAIDKKLGILGNRDWKQTPKPLYPYKKNDFTNYKTMLYYNIKAKVLGKPVKNIPFKKL